MTTWQALVAGFFLGLPIGALIFALLLWQKIGLPPKGTSLDDHLNGP